MDKIKKKIKSKIFKSSAGPEPRRDPKLRHSMSMPLRPSCDTEESYVLPRPPRATEDFHPIPGQRYPGWPEYDVDPDDFSRPYNPRSHFDKVLINQFPKPPSTIPKCAIPKPLPPTPPTPRRPARPPTLDFSDVATDHLLPDFPPELTAKIVALDAEQVHRQQAKHAESAKAARNAAILRTRQTPAAIQRSASSMSGTLPLNIRRRDASNHTAFPSAQPSGSLYQNYSASQSTRSLNPNARYRACLASSRQPPSVTHISSNSGCSTYSNETFTNSLSQNARYHAAPTASDSLDAVPAVEDDGATVRRRNASSASSRSALAMRRNGLLPPPADHHDMLRVLRGPHAAKLQAPPTPAKGMGLPVNDTNSDKEWGVKGSKNRGAATVAGYRRGACGQRR
ncbi:hypothetical protein DXG01_016714 [Tephrocybe rancida]|nr:hypothetical protein DXG01_016714 [Tephrocybe rancida]